MNYLERLSFGFSKKLPIVLQTEIAECGLACLTSIAGYHGYHSDLRTMRQKYSLSQKGLTLADIVRFANDLNLTSRALRLDLDDLPNLRTPCILHWDLNHFVVLKEVRKDGIYGKDESGRELAEILFSEVRPGIFNISHTGVDTSLRGQGIAGDLVRRAVEEIERRGGKAETTCSYAEGWMKKHRG